MSYSGKTTITEELRDFISNLVVLDGDKIREWFSSKDFSKEGRNEHNKRVAYITKLLIDHKVQVCVSLISPFRENRDTARAVTGKDRVIETYLKCSLEVCESRDTKGLYRKARNNKILEFTGIQSPCEEPIHPDLILDTEKLTPEQDCRLIISYLKKRKFLQ